MFDRLIDLLIEFLKAFQPCGIILEYQQAVRLRFGHYKETLNPGFYWMIPFWIDDIIYDHVTPTVDRIPAMSTTTKDGKAIGFEGVITYKISDIKKALLEVTQVHDAIVDACAGTIGGTLSTFTWEQIWHGEADDTISTACRKRGWRWGVEIMSVQLAGVCLTRNLRIMQSGAVQHHHPAPP
jgi:regulator of protease activity HflC (stomatin/prohibitin superfamily)